MDIKGLKKYLKEVEADCLKLKKRNNLTLEGKGTLSVIRAIKVYLKNMPKNLQK